MLRAEETSNMSKNRVEPKELEEALNGFFAGFDLVGRRTLEGKILSHFSKKTFPFDEWPKEITMYGNTYTLEEIVYGINGYETAQYI